MDKFKSKKKRCAEKTPLNVIGSLAMPKELQPWERDLLGILLEAVHGSAEQGQKADSEVAS